MYTNSKKISNRFLQNSKKLFLCNSHLSLNPATYAQAQNDFNTVVMKNYLEHRSLEEIQYYYDNVLETSKMKNYIGDKLEEKKQVVVEKFEELISFKKNDQIFYKNLNLQAACNILYLLGQYKISEQRIEEFILALLKVKGIENLNLSNLVDLKMFLKNYPNSVISELKDDIENLIQQKLVLYQNLVYLRENGNSIDSWEQDQQSQQTTYSEKLVTDNFHEDDLLSYYQYRYLLPIKNIFQNILNLKNPFENQIEEITKESEFRRLQELNLSIQKFENQQVKNIESEQQEDSYELKDKKNKKEPKKKEKKQTPVEPQKTEPKKKNKQFNK